MKYTDQEIRLIAMGAHEAIRAYNVTREDLSLPAWDDVGAQMQASSITGVETCLKGATPRQQHDQWMATRIADGWTWGPETDRAKKINSALVPYDQLPEWQRVKDEVFQGAVRAGAEIVRQLRR